MLGCFILLIHIKKNNNKSESIIKVTKGMEL